MIETSLDFVSKAKEIHGDRYDYRNCVYTGERALVIVNCGTHGPFEIKAVSHLQGDICYKCKLEDWKKINRTSGNFVRKAVLKHGEFYDYSETVYTGSTNKLKIKCPEHGEFELTATKHLMGEGCPICKKIQKTTSNTDDFIVQAKSVHGDTYDYDGTVYMGLYAEIKINCKVHGEYLQIANDHLLGCGCIKCGENQISLQDFQKKAQVVHGNRYDYSDSILTSLYEKIKIKCPIHGEFEQLANFHLAGVGCNSCKNYRTTNENFVHKAKAVHGDKYDYSATIYTGSINKVEIICPNHGSFLQRPSTHLMGSGCPECAKITTSDFVKKAKLVHGDLYDYENTVYNGSQKEVTIKCRIHGEFEQLAYYHLKGAGCGQCTTQKLTTQSFKEKAQLVHGDRYDYDSTIYVSSKEKVSIKCRIHGEFEQLAYYHLKGSGCVQCYRPALTTETYKIKAQKVHGGRYSYEDTVYTGAHGKVTIKCKIHGNFEKKATSHLSGVGCALCKEKKFTTETFKEQAKLVHGNRYDYSDSIFKGMGHKLKIKCRTHGEFEQTASSHLNGHGCRFCNTRKLSSDDFKARAKLVHGDLYDYSETVFTILRNNVNVRCKVHGIFEVNANNHLNGSGCKKCRSTKKAK